MTRFGYNFYVTQIRVPLKDGKLGWSDLNKALKSRKVPLLSDFDGKSLISYMYHSWKVTNKWISEIPLFDPILPEMDYPLFGVTTVDHFYHSLEKSAISANKVL